VRWEAVFAVFVVSHIVGDFVLQTEWQALNKRGGLSSTNRVARRALVSHVLVYTLCFAPALIWVVDRTTALAVGLVPVIFIPHLLQDDGRALVAWNRRVKNATFEPNHPVYIAVDQSFHVVVLFATALLAVA
jgi:Protein of unknown function (DUF3307)